MTRIDQWLMLQRLFRRALRPVVAAVTLRGMKRRSLLLLEDAKGILPRILLEESGQDLVEYSLLLVLVGAATIGAVDRWGDELYYTFRRIARLVTTQGRDYD